MQKIIPILLVIVILASGCLQLTVENQEKFDEYQHPDLGFTMKYPESWNITDQSPEFHLPNFSLIVFSSPDNQAVFNVAIHHYYYPEGEEIGGWGESREWSNATLMMFSNNTQIGGLTGFQWIYLEKGPDREYYDNSICITQICQGLQNNRRDYILNYEYTTGDPQLEETVNAILNSIEFSCPAKK